MNLVLYFFLMQDHMQKDHQENHQGDATCR